MSDVVTGHSETAQWYRLVNEAEAAAGTHLPEEVESYLVFLLMRFRSRPEMAGRILALDYLRGLLSGGRLREQRLQEVGDHCLLLSGFFPQRARRLNVSVDYFVDLGQGAYHSLASLDPQQLGRLFAELGERFVVMMDLLRRMRRLGGPARWRTAPAGRTTH